MIGGGGAVAPGPEEGFKPGFIHAHVRGELAAGRPETDGGQAAGGGGAGADVEGGAVQPGQAGFGDAGGLDDERAFIAPRGFRVGGYLERIGAGVAGEADGDGRRGRAGSRGGEGDGLRAAGGGGAGEQEAGQAQDHGGAGGAADRGCK